MILKYPNKILRQPSHPIITINDEVKQLADNMLKTVMPDPLEPMGVGLAAPQVGINKRLFLMLMPDKKITPVINPQILKSSKKMHSSLPQKTQFLEGCLSIPNYYGFVDRPVKIKVTYQTLTGEIKTARLAHPYSIYFQHERDHLDGILFIDYLKKSKEQLFYGSGRDSLKPVKNPF